MIETINSFARDGGESFIKGKENRDKLSQEMNFKNREGITFISCAKSFLNPQEAFDFIMGMGIFPDSQVFNAASEALKKLAPQVDMSGIIDNFPSEDSPKRALILGCMPLPVDEEIFEFIFKAATSSYQHNRFAFLDLIYRMRNQNPPLSENALSLIKRTLLSFQREQSPAVLSTWLKPAFHYLKDDKKFPSILANIAQNGDVEVKTSLSLRFAEAYAITKEVNILFTSNTPKIIAALIPSLPALHLPDSELSPIFANRSNIVRVLVLRYFENIPDQYINDYMKDNSNEVLNDLVRYLGKHNNKIDYLKRIFSKIVTQPETSWRLSYEMLSLPIETLLEIGEDAFKFALKKAEEHPFKLMKCAAEVLTVFAQADPTFSEKVESFINELIAKNTPYSLQAVKIMNANSS